MFLRTSFSNGCGGFYQFSGQCGFRVEGPSSGWLYIMVLELMSLVGFSVLPHGFLSEKNIKGGFVEKKVDSNTSDVLFPPSKKN